MKLLQKSLLMTAATAAILLAGCKQNTQSNDSAQAQKDGSSTMQQAANDVKNNTDIAAAAVGDATITAKVKAAIIAEPTLKATDIKVDTANGVVTLSGDIDTVEKVQRATQLAQNVDGVRTVNNQLSVKAAS
jgi:hyperosmotically inducible protein